MTSMPASRSARAMIFAPRSCPSRPGLATTTRILRAVAALTGGADPPSRRPPRASPWPVRAALGAPGGARSGDPDLHRHARVDLAQQRVGAPAREPLRERALLLQLGAELRRAPAHDDVVDVLAPPDPLD